MKMREVLEFKSLETRFVASGVDAESTYCRHSRRAAERAELLPGQRRDSAENQRRRAHPPGSLAGGLLKRKRLSGRSHSGARSALVQLRRPLPFLRGSCNDKPQTSPRSEGPELPTKRRWFCPDDFTGRRTGETFTCACRAGSINDGPVWGTDTYTSDSRICTAASPRPGRRS